MRLIAFRGVVQAELPVFQQVTVVGLENQTVAELQRAFAVILEITDGIDRPVKLALAYQLASYLRCFALFQFLRHGHCFHRERVGLHYVQLIIAGGEAESEQPQTESCQ